ncbi:MAG TPA: exodeoxyribonuclease V subunit alpha [Egibacteraceae bacterium]|nr:exodeoxyribonuclease V subunit alpha [Egibacteraceae bacterium]
MSTAEHVEPLDAFDVRRAVRAQGLLRAFNDAGVLAPADVHVAGRLGTLGGEDDAAVLLAAALAVRATRLGHVCTDLATAPATVTTEAEQPVDVAALAWPGIDAWTGALTASPLVALGADGPADRPLRLVGTRLYLDRYWREERRVAADLRARSAEPAAGVNPGVLAGGLRRLFPADVDAPVDLQRLAAAAAVVRRFAVVAGGPGTGKTTTVARILALLDEQAGAAGAAPPRVALAAPTGKAAARMEEAVHEEAARLDVDAGLRARLLAAGASTLHRLLGWRPDSRSRFRHDRGNRLPHDVVVVDETSMVSLSLMAKLVEAVRSDARLILVGDPEQLASVEAGAVLGDIVGPAAASLRIRADTRAVLSRATGQPVPAEDPPASTAVGDGIVVLRRVHRFGGAIAELARAVQRGDADKALAVLGSGAEDVRWIPDDVAETGPDALASVRDALVDAGRRLAACAHAGDGRGALTALGAMRVLCAHRRGPYGVATWMAHVEGWLAAAIEGYATGGRWYVGRPLLVTANDYGLRLYNGDTGVVIDTGQGRVTAVFERRGEVMEVSPARLSAVDTVHAMTVHKSQGSQFTGVAVLLPDATSPILTRELLYTAVTRAQTHLTVVGPEASIRAAVTRPIARASGLREALWA